MKYFYHILGILQPADVGWFKVLKTLYRKHWCDWFLNGDKKFTKHGNLAGPGYDKMSNWLLKCWKEYDVAQIIHSFQYCGITCDTPDDYHSELKQILASIKIPANVTIEPQEEYDDPNLINTFANFVFEEDGENDDDDDEYVLSEESESENSESLSEISSTEELDLIDSDSSSDSNLEENDENFDSNLNKRKNSDGLSEKSTKKSKIVPESPKTPALSLRSSNQGTSSTSKTPNLSSKFSKLSSKSPIEPKLKAKKVLMDEKSKKVIFLTKFYPKINCN